MKQARALFLMAMVCGLCWFNASCSGLANNQGMGTASGSTPPPAPNLSVTVSPTEVVGGAPAVVTVTFATAAPAPGLMASLTSANSQIAAVPVAPISVSGGATSATFALTTTAPATQTAVMISASVTVNGTGGGSSTGSVMLTVDPASASQVTGLNLSTSTVNGGLAQPVIATVTLAPTPTNPTVVQVSSSNTMVATTVPASVSFAAGQASGVFNVNTVAVASVTPITLTAAMGGQTPSQATATLTVNPPQVTGIAFAPATVAGGQSTTGTITLSSVAPTGGAAVVLSSSAGSAPVPGTITVPGGSTTASFNITTLGVATQTVATIQATFGGATKNATVTINPPAVSGLTFNPTSTTAGQMVTGILTLNANAPAGGLSVTLMSNNQTAVPVPASVTVPAGSSTETFTLTTGSVSGSTPVAVTATTGSTTVMGTLTVNPTFLVTAVTFNPGSVQGGTGSQGTVTLNFGAPAGGLTVSLASGDPSTTVPRTVVVAGGSTTQTFNATTTGVAVTTNATVTATLGASNASGSLTVTPASIVSVVFNPATVLGGATSQGTVTLNGPAPSAGMTVTLNSNATAVATVPANFSFTGGATTGTFTATAVPVATNSSAMITATLPSGNAMAGTLNVNAPTIVALSFNPTNVVNGQATTGTVTLNGKAPTGGVTVGLAITSGNAADANVPASMMVPGGSTTGTFQVMANSVASASPLTVTGTTGAVSAMGGFTVIPPILLTGNVSFAPSSVLGGSGSTGTVTISQSAPTGGVSVSLASGDAAVGVPAAVMVPAGSTMQTFAVTTSGVATTDPVTVTATLGTSNATGTLTLNPASITSVTFNPASVAGGSSSIGTVTLNGTSPTGGLTVGLMSNVTAAATVPTTFSFPGAATTGTFTATALPVATSTPVTITATLPSGNALGGTLTVIPPVIAMVSFNPSTIGLGQISTGTVKLNGNAPAAGLTVGLMSNDTTAIPVPPSVTVPGGASTQTFQVTGGSVSSLTTVTVTGTTGTTSAMGMITVNPALMATPSSVVFTSGTLVGVPSTQTITLTNTTGAAITINGIVASSEFTQTNNCPASLGVGANCVITLTPTQGGSLTGNVTITSGGSNMLVVNLSGTAMHWVSVSWTESDPTATGFNVYRQTQSGGACGTPSVSTYTRLNSTPVSTTSYSDLDPTLVPNTTYCYAITAVASGSAESPFSAAASAHIPMP